MRTNSLLTKQKASRYSLLLREFQHLFAESQQPMLHYIVPEKGWSSDWIGYYITRWVQKLGMKAHLSAKPPRVKGDIIHYADTVTMLKHFDSPANRYNWLAATIFHGDKTENNPDIEKVIEYSHDLNKLIVPNETMFERFTEWGIRSDKLICIPLGVDLNSFFPASNEERLILREKFDIPENSFCVGSFQKDGLGWSEGESPDLKKGPDIFLETVEKLSEKIPKLHVFLTGPARGYVREGLEKIGVSHCHHTIDPYQEIRDCYACLDVYIITAREQGGPGALLESMACGIPVVSTAMGMASDTIESNHNGILVEQEDISALIEGVMLIDGDPDFANRLSMAAMNSARDYDWSTISALYFEHVYAPLMVQRYS